VDPVIGFIQPGSTPFKDSAILAPKLADSPFWWKSNPTPLKPDPVPMEQRALKNVNNNLNINIYPYFETSGGQSSNIYLNVVNFFNTSVN
jgi:hypothetical protein